MLSSTDIESIQSSYGSSVIERMLNKPRKSLEDVLPTAPVDGLDLLRRLLQFNPGKRPTAEEVLRHPYVSRFHNSDDEPTLDHEVHPPLSDDQQLSVDEYRKKLYEVRMTRDRTPLSNTEHLSLIQNISLSNTEHLSL
jgi:mitogen-activated protein kinase 15